MTNSFKLILSLIIFISIFPNSLIYGQGNNNASTLNYAPTTPEVASLGKFIETPVSLYSGIPQITIPIEIVKSGALKIPISLDYHAGGIKVDETASWVGLGWHLNSGGSITRIVRGIADDSPGGFLNTNISVQNFEDIPKNNQNMSEINDIIDRSLNGELDFEPDMYYYNFAGYSGGFFFSQSGQIHIMPHNDIKIEPYIDSYNKILSWIVTTPEGSKYHFGVSKDGQRTGNESVLSTIVLDGNRNRSGGYTTGWNLMDAIDHNGNDIKFTYSFQTYSTCTASGQQRYLNAVSPPNTGNSINGKTPITYYNTSVRSSKISRIEGRNITLDFIKNTIERLDIPDDYALDEIVINSGQRELKRVKFNYEDIVNISSQNSIPCSGEERYHRMFLKSLQEFNTTEFKPPYVMKYNSLKLPDRYSFAKDFWGYYNGNLTNTSLIPTVTLKGIRYEDANRFVNANYSIAGMLEEITYPTGGSTRFEYEGNTTSQVVFSNILAPRERIGVASINTADLLNGNPYNYNESFTISQGELLDNILYIDVSFPCDVTDRECGIEIRIINENTNSFVQLSVDTQMVLEPGNYSIWGRIFDDGEGNYPDFSVNLYGEQYEIEEGNNYQVGGLRIKSIKNYNDDTLETTRTYLYNVIGDLENLSSGRITSKPIFVEENSQYYLPLAIDNLSTYNQVTVDIISSSSTNPFTTTKSGYVGYLHVTEIFGDEIDNTGKKEYQYSFALDDDSGTGYFPNPPRTILEWLRGNLRKERTYKKEGNNFVPVQQSVNNYIYYRNSSDIFYNQVKGIKMDRRSITSFYAVYTTGSEWFKLDNSIKSFYYGSDSVSVSYKNSYLENESKHVLPIELTTLNNNSEKYIERILYPTDIIGPSVTEQKLINDFRINIPLKSETFYKKGNNIEKRLEATETIYYDWGNNIILPSIIKTSKGDNPTIDKILYENYDNNGNPLQVSLAGGISISYIWGYNKEYPIAKLENINYTNLQSYVSNIETLSNLDNDRTIDGKDVLGNIIYNGAEGDLREALDALRENFPNAMVTTYTYDPLIGVTSITDPQGLRVYFIYDEFNRLKEIRDQDNNLVEDYQYNYRENP